MTLSPGLTLYFIRHGETDWNREGRLQGQQDIPLNPLGRAQAEEAGRRLGRLAPDPTALDFVASPLARTRATMEGLRGALGLDPGAYRLDPRLKELTFGDWEGKTWREVRAAFPGAAATREERKWDFTPPGGESYATLTERVVPAVADLVRDTALVSHGGVARALLAALCGLPTSEATRVDIWQGRILVIRDGTFRWV